MRFVTCVVGIVDGSEALLGADSTVMGDDERYEWDGKVWKIAPGLVMGGAGDLDAVQRARYALKPSAVRMPSLRSIRDIEAWLVMAFVPALTDSLEGMSGAQFLIGARGTLWTLATEDRSVLNVGREYAIGSGAQAARGALWSTRVRSPSKRLEVALCAAEAVCESVLGPMVSVRG